MTQPTQQDTQQSTPAEKQSATSGVSFAFDEQASPATANVMSWFSRTYIVLLMLALMCGLLFWVMFILPNTIEKADIILKPSAVPAKAAPAKLLEQSPWQDAQLAKHRRAAQDILAKVLEKQQLLEDKRIALWGQVQFSEALDQATTGDELYRSQEFSKAMVQYNLALAQLDELELRVPLVYQSYLDKGLAALIDGNAILAKEKLAVAMAIDPNATEAAQAFDRALTLDQVNALVKAGIVMLDERQLEAAKGKFSQALGLDPMAQDAKQHLKQVGILIKQRDYSLAMSRGYNAINNNQSKAAIKYFSQAQHIDPQSAAPAKGIKQSKNLITKNSISHLMTSARQREAQYDWLGAKTLYREALERDKTLMEARVGALRTNARADLIQQLDTIIDKPQRLANDKIYIQAKASYRLALKTKAPEQALVTKIALVKQILSDMKLPVTVQIESDNRTHITLYQVGKLGNFKAKKLSLTPGSYTIVGSRSGYRDVRQQFTLLPKSALTTIVIQCKDKVTNG